jgi:16S rRNA (guanine527-N7)-methyltransferase
MTCGPRLAKLAERYELPPRAAAALAALLDLLERDEHAPTTVRSATEAVDAHVADSLAALDLPAVREAGTVVDLGSGAGFPGLALAVALPAARVSLVESAARKCRFLARAVEAAGAANVEIVHARAEEWASRRRDGFDVVTARALAPLAVVAEYAAPLLRLDGVLVAWKGRVDEAETAAAGRAAGELGLAIEEVRRVAPFRGARDRHLHVVRKAAPTPARFPRRPGMAAKRPLGGS